MKDKDFYEETDLKSLDLDVLLKMTVECIREIQSRKAKIYEFINNLDTDLVALMDDASKKKTNQL